MQIKPISEIKSIELVPIKDFALIQKIEKEFEIKIKFCEYEDYGASFYYDYNLIKINPNLHNYYSYTNSKFKKLDLKIIYESVIFHEIGHLLKDKKQKIDRFLSYKTLEFYIREEIAANVYGMQYAINNGYSYDKEIMFAYLLYEKHITLNKIDLIEKALLKQKNNLTSQKNCVNV